MKNIFSVADRYVQESDWKVLSMLKICLLALGTMIGIRLAPEHRRPVFLCCLAVFIATYVPLMAKLVRLYLAKDADV